jgi:hypothetical protein
MSKYDSLARYLSEVGEFSITMSFNEIAAIVDGGLPASAYEYRPWWANRYDGNDAQNKGWQSVGWETGDVDMKRQAVTFTRTFKVRADFSEKQSARELTIDEAKQGLALKFGVEPDRIDIIIRA